MLMNQYVNEMGGRAVNTKPMSNFLPHESPGQVHIFHHVRRSHTQDMAL